MGLPAERQTDRWTARQTLHFRICFKHFALKVVFNTAHLELISECKSWVLCPTEPVGGQALMRCPGRWWSHCGSAQEHLDALGVVV